MIYSETLGSGPDVIFLHGLFGAGDNWRSIGRQLSKHYRVHLLDLPNHGRSAWLDNPTLSNLAAAVNDWIRARGITHYRLLGHSLGGKVAMQLALNDHEGELTRLIVVDIAPKPYPPHHKDIFLALQRADLSALPDRKAVEADIADLVTDMGVRQFLLKSLYKQDGKLAWRFNLQILESRYESIAQAPTMTRPYIGPALFIKGMNSSYIVAADQELILSMFPYSTAKLIEGTGHWPHGEKPLIFGKLLKDFLDQEGI
ncbi:alpha/beta fold hydrolase [Reinekea sp.]|jgi:esterase|uniref:alpha/beta fold hydrolase n=1 Tax=Reinekea sp. TaxID=1970455 RepID=UPI002A83CFD3|nr:alpha/beta fold hydrolase [Reinekea sp.]